MLELDPELDSDVTVLGLVGADQAQASYVVGPPVPLPLPPGPPVRLDWTQG